MNLILLVVWLAAYPDVTIRVETFPTEKACHEAFVKLDKSTQARLKYECRVTI